MKPDLREWPRALSVALFAVCLTSGWTAGAGAAIVEGRVIHPTRPEAVADLEIQAMGIGADPNAGTIERTTRTDAKGRFRFDDLPSPAAYLLRTIFQGVLFPGGTAVFRPGDPESVPPITFHVYDSSDDASALSIHSMQWVVERDAGIYRVDVNAQISNDGNKVVRLDPNAPPALRLPLPAGHGEIETPFGRLPAGVTIEGDELQIRGPVLPGEDGLQVNFAFELGGGAPELVTELRFPDPVDQLNVYVRDFGIDVHAEGLHPARPARQNDVFYLSFVGFDLPSGYVSGLRVTPLQPAWIPSDALVAGLVALLAGGLLFLVGRPITESGPHIPEEPEDDERRHGDALSAALRDLEHDFETGKLSPEDRDRLRGDLRHEAALALARERSIGSSPEQKPEETTGHSPRRTSDAVGPDEPRVCSCGRKARSDDRFCGGCGREL